MTDDRAFEAPGTVGLRTLETLISDLQVFLWACDHRGAITAWLGQELSIAGSSAEKALGQSAFDRFKEVPQIIEDLRRALDGKAFTSIVEVGATVLEMRYSPQTTGSDQPMGAVCLTFDISGRSRMEDHFKAREERLMQAFDSAALGLALLAVDGRFIYTNAALSGLLGDDDLSLHTSSLLERCHPDDREKLGELLRKLLSDEIQEIQTETRFQHLDRVLWAQISISKIEDPLSKPILLFAQLQDISDYQATFETTGSATVIIGEDTTLLKVNTEFEKLSGYKRAELEGKKSWTEFVVEDDLERIQTYHRQRRIDENSAPPSYEFQFMDREGAVKDIILTIALIPGSTRSVASLLDISAQKAIERALRSSEEKYRLVVEHASEAIAIVQDGLLRFVNPKALELTGFSTERLLSRPFAELIHPQDRQMFQERHIRRLQGDAPESAYDFRIIDASGGEKWVQINAVLIDWAGKPATLNFLTDITERKRAEQALEESENRYRQLVEEAADVVYTTDTQGYFTYANAAAETLTGYSNKEIIGMHFSDLVPKTWREEIRSFYEQQFIQQIAETVLELPIRTRSGEQLWIEQTVGLLSEGGRVTGFQSILRDITARKQTEIALKESEERYRSLVELSPEAIGVHSEGRIVYVNPAGLRLFGAANSSEILGSPVLDRVHPDYRGAVEERVRQSYEARESAGLMEQKMLRLDGETVDVEVATEPIFFEGKRATQIVIRDITDRKRAQVALQRFTERLHILRRIDRAILAAKSPEEIARSTLANLIHLLECQRASIVIFDHEPETATVLASFQSGANVIAGGEQMPMHFFDSVRQLGPDEVKISSDLTEDWPSAPLQQQLMKQGIRSVLIVPLFAHHQMIGTVNLGRKENGTFEEEQVEVAREIAGPLAVAIQQARLHGQVAAHASELEQRVTALRENERYLEVLNDITKSALALEDELVLLQALADRLAELYHADGSFITLWDEELNQPIFTAAHGPLRDRFATMSPAAPEEKTLSGSVLETGTALIAEDVFDSPYISPSFAERFSAKSALGLPLVAGGKKLGAAVITFDQQRQFSSEEISRGEQAAGQVALALAKAQSLALERKRRKEAETLRTVSNALVSTLDLEQVLDLILDQLGNVIGFDSASVMLYQDNKLRAVVGRGFKNQEEVVGQIFPADDELFQVVLRTRSALWLQNPAADPRFKAWGSTSEIRSWMAVPMLARGKIIGYMTLDSYQSRAYGEATAALVQPFANQAAQAIENAQLFDWMQKQAVTDALTGLYNRRGLFELGQREVERAHRFGRPLTAIMIDLDHFKRVNDRFGHYTGDQVLVEIARRCLELLRKVDLLGRYGGEEFAILLPETDVEVAVEIAERLRAEIAATTVGTDRTDIHVTISLGVAPLTDDIEDLAGLLDAADGAMYMAKQAGRNCVRIFGA